MANSSTEYWDIDGTSLHQFGWSVATVGGGRYDLPPRRGSNMTFPYRPGQVHRPKLADARVVTLVMWMIGMTPGTGLAPADQVLQWNDNWDFLRRLVWKPTGSQVALTRRWHLTVGGTPTLLAATAQAEVSDPMAPTMTGRTRADFTMNLLLADPYFYGDQVNLTVSVGGTLSVANPGHDTAAHANALVEFTGPLTNPRLTNTTASPDIWVQYTGSIPSGQTIKLDIGRFTAVLLSDLTNRIKYISNAGSRWWMEFPQGTSSLTLTGSGAGYARVVFRPPYV